MIYIDIILIFIIFYILYTLYRTRKILSNYISYNDEQQQKMLKIIIDMSIEFKDFKKDYKISNDKFEIFKREYRNDKTSILKNIKKIQNESQ